MGASRPRSAYPLAPCRRASSRSASSRWRCPPTRARTRRRPRPGWRRRRAAAPRWCACRSSTAPPTSASARTTPSSTWPRTSPGRAAAASRRWRAAPACRSWSPSSSGGRPASTTTARSSWTPTARSRGTYRKMHIPDDPAFYEKFYFTPGDLGFRAFDVAAGTGRHPDLLGPVVPGGRAPHRAARARPSSSTRPPSAGTRPRRRPSARPSATPGAPSSARTPSPTASTSAAVNRVGLEPGPAGQAGARVLGLELPLRSLRPGARRGLRRPGGDPDRRGRPRAHRGGPPPLALPARSAHRRLRRHRPPLPRLRTPWRRAAREPPARLPWRMPAEWEPHEATWLAWPHAVGDWPGRFGPIPWVYADIVREGRRGRDASASLVNDAAHEAKARRHLVAPRRRPRPGRLPAHPHRPRLDARLRAHLRRGGGAGRRAVAGFRFNAWAKYPDWRRDDRVPERAARGLGLPLLPVRRGGRDVVLEGGAIDVNGAGHHPGHRGVPARPGRPGAQSRVRPARLRGGLPRRPRRARHHLARARASPATTPTATSTTWPASSPPPPSCWPGRTTRPTRTTPSWPRTGSGSPRRASPTAGAPRWSTCPCRGRSSSTASASRPATPTSTSPTPRCSCRPSTTRPTAMALGILAELFPDRPVVGIHAVDLVWGLGTLHCLTQQEPAGP